MYDKKINSLYTKGINLMYGLFFEDRRCRFYDLSKIKPQNRIAKSSIIQFYSSVHNIGNYLPVLGIRIMLAQTPDTWCVHDKKIDFEFINNNYQCAIIGGAGLLIEGFEHFWDMFLRKCKIPAIIWGVGTGNINRISKPYQQIVSEVGKRCELVNVRDEYTADLFNLSNAHISACPTIIYVAKNFHKNKSLALQSKQINVCCYPQHHSFKQSEFKKIKKISQRFGNKCTFTTNTQYKIRGLDDIIRDKYVKSALVVTTKLHGAIIAYGLGIPYISFGRTDKINAFQQKFKNGLSVNNCDELEEVLNGSHINELSMNSIEFKPVTDFGERVSAWITNLNK